MRPVALAIIACLLLPACGPIDESETPAAVAGPTARILLVGDVMLGRGVANLAENDPDSLFAGVRHLLAAADVVGGNLESPLTDSPHTSQNENVLEASPASAATLATAGFDVMSVANNHATDAGGAGLLDTVSALREVGVANIGGGLNRTAALAAAAFAVDGISIGFVAFDATGVAESATNSGSKPGVAAWEGEESLDFVRGLSRLYDVLVVSIHGGTEYLTVTDPGMADIGADLVAAGADVVWGHGAHVVQPIQLSTGDHPAVVATSLGNFLFDQSGPDRTTGAMLEVLADKDGVVAYKVGITEHPDRTVELVEWLEPIGDAVYLHDSWWGLARTPEVAAQVAPVVEDFPFGDLVVAATGDIDGSGAADLVVSFRRRYRTTPFMELHPDTQFEDAAGRSAHLGVFNPADLREIWVAGSVLMPVAQMAVCDGTLAVVHDQLDDPTPIAAGAWEWNGFGFDTGPTISGGGTPGCVDIDGDGRTDPVITGR